MNDDVLIDVRDVSYAAGAVSILENINFNVMRNEIITIIGPNGSGKTTLVKIILGLIKPAAGKVYRRSHIRIGYAPQNFSVNRYFPITVASLLSSTISTDIDINYVVKLIGIEDLLRKSLGELSSGQLKLVMLAKALTVGNHVLILDEVASCLDLNQKDKFYKILRVINIELGCAIILVSHDLLMIMRYTDKVLCINKSMCCLDRPRNVVRHPAFVKLFGDDFQNLAVYDHIHHCQS